MLTRSLLFHLENAGVAGIWPSQLDSLRIFAKAYGFTTLAYVDATTDGVLTGFTDDEIVWSRHATLEDWWARLGSAADTVIGMETASAVEAAGGRATSILELAHPTDGEVWYAFGPTMGFPGEFIDDEKEWTYLPTLVPVGALSGYEALVMTLGHRYFNVDAG